MKKWAFCSLVLLLGLATPALAAKLTVSGEVTYRERMAMPANAVLRVMLIDVDDPQGPPKVEGQAPIATAGQVPLDFALNFEDTVVAVGNSYGMVAEIVADGKLYFSSPAPVPVDPFAAAGPVSILVSFVGQQAPPAPPAAGAEVLGVVWRATAIAGQPVAARIKSSLSIAADLRAGGRGGCNSWFAQAELDASALRFSTVATTRVSCTDAANAQETAYFAALAATRFWRIDGGQLFLTDASGADLVAMAKD